MADWSYSPIVNAYEAYLSRDYETAQLNYLVAAEMGYEVAQANLAWLLEKGNFISNERGKSAGDK